MPNATTLQEPVKLVKYVASHAIQTLEYETSMYAHFRTCHFIDAFALTPNLTTPLSWFSLAFL
jgi:hypothetical protein